MSYKIQTKKCKGCGAWLNNDKNKIGFTPKDYNAVDLCQSCYKLKHYQTIPDMNLNDDQEFQKNINGFILNEKSNSSSFLSILVTDIYNLSFLDKIENYPLVKNILICINKKELISYQQSEIIKKLWNDKLSSLNKNFEIILVSAKNNQGINLIIKKMEKFREICFIGNSSVGKSYLINKILHKLGYENKNNNIVGNYLNTTKGIIKTTIDKMKILDTPGSKRDNGIFQFLNPNLIKKIQNSKWNKKIFQIYESRIYLFEKFVMIKINNPEKKKIVLTFDGSEEIKVIHTKVENYENNKNYSFLKDLSNEAKIISHKFMIDKKSYFIIDDLGFFQVKCETQTEVEISLPEKVKITEFIMDK